MASFLRTANSSSEEDSTSSSTSSIPIVKEPDQTGYDPDRTITSLSGLERAAALNPVEVIDDLSINRWLMRIMRLGQGGRFSGSAGYGQHATTQASIGARGRRMSAFEVNYERSSDKSGAYLRPPATSRGRRFSDSMSLAGVLQTRQFGSASKSRKGESLSVRPVP